MDSCQTAKRRLGHSNSVTVEHVRWYVENPGLFVWVENSKIVAFSAADPRNGQALFKRAIEVFNAAGCPRMWLTTWPGTRAERFYRRAEWPVTGIKRWKLGIRKGGTDHHVIMQR